ncbi:hypothetical protein KR200_011116 [Drosophila serrata]|nr:hypothetical protein KR200_011116 [Drosophila serrata]
MNSTLIRRLRPSFADLPENKKFSDCRILVENETFDCHKVILASSSDFFERLFLSSFKEAKQDEIRLQEVKPKTFAVFIQYVYTYDSAKLKEYGNSMIMELLSCGTRWMVDSIVNACVTILKERVGTMLLSDLLELFQTACSIDNKELRTLSSLGNRFSKEMNCYDVLTMTSDVFEQYTIITEGHLPEFERFKMIETYCTVNGLIYSKSADTVDTSTKKSGDSGICEMIAAKPSIDDEEPENSDENDEFDDEVLSEKSEDDEEYKDKPKNTKIKMMHSKYVKTLLGYIKFNNMRKDEFYKIVGKSPLLSLKEKYNYLYLTRN